MKENSEVREQVHAAALRVAFYLADLTCSEQIVVLTLHLKALAVCINKPEEELLETIGTLLEELRE